MTETEREIERVTDREREIEREREMHKFPTIKSSVRALGGTLPKD